MSVTRHSGLISEHQQHQRMKSEGELNWPFVINLGNSIIGVSILAMPFCFKQCGIILGSLVLLFCTWLTLASCRLLVKAGIVSHRRSYEFLAYHTYGAPGKFVVEVCMIGMQIGTLIAQIVVIGDLGPDIINTLFGVEKTANTRLYLMLTLCLCVGLPLGLIKDMRSVSRVSTICVMFYTTFIVYILFISGKNLMSGTWYTHVNFWRKEGIFQCLPIFSFSFGCQTQLFILYEALPEPSLHAIKGIINSAVSLCALAYFMVGFLGYVTFYEGNIPGDVMKLFPSTFGANVMKLGFVLSIAITFPVIIFPCRASIYTLVFQKDFHDLAHSAMETSDVKKMKHGDDVIGNYIPEQIFKAITIGIVLVSTITGILIPNVEFILGLNGAITGTLICYIFPALFFLHVMSSKAEGKTIAQIVLALGLVFLLVSTFTTLKTPDSSQVQQSAGIPDHLSHHLAGNPEIDSNWHKDQLDSVKKDGAKVDIEKRVEPPNPQEDLAKKAIGNNIVAEGKGPKPLDQHDTDDVNKAKQFPAEGAQDQAAKEGRGGDKADLERHDDKRRQQELLAALEAQRAEQERLLIEQKAVLQELKDHKKEHEIDGPEKQIQQVANDQKPGQAFPVDQKVDQNIIPQQPNDVQAKPMPHQDHQQQEQPVVIANEVAPQQQKQPLQDVGDPQNLLQSQQELQVDKLPGPVQNVPEQVKDQIQQQQNLVKQPQIPDQQPQAQAQEVPQQEQVLPGAKSGQADLAQQPGIAVQQDQVPIIPENVKIDAVRSKREVVGNVMPVVSPVEKHISTKGEVEKTGARKDLVVPMKSSSVDDQGDKEEMRRRLKEAGYEDAVADHVPDLDMSKVVQSIVNQGIVIRSLKDHRD